MVFFDDINYRQLVNNKPDYQQLTYIPTFISVFFSILLILQSLDSLLKKVKEDVTVVTSSNLHKRT